MGQRLVKKNRKISKKKNFFFFSQVFLRPAHYTLGTLLGPKSQKKHELGCFEHLEFIPQPFSVPPVHFVWASALSKNRKISKKKIFFFGKISTTEVGLWALGFIFYKSFNSDTFFIPETHSTVCNFWWSQPFFSRFYAGFLRTSLRKPPIWVTTQWRL